ncbi:hypothetical protein [Fibrella forsythiae]|uniref:Uncharacterized protein n=1 Tax=Fibrella forsythiae TaxID=2817061 RepID=A0ABS3JUD5_9BACT|nr:hypothetical protein [Fibrella forsythiae]MBO0953011.1 hypothetical protein [Fibrella forsythiae]
MATTLPPPRKKPVTEAQIEAVINKGGSTTQKAEPITEPQDTVKYFNLRLTAGVLKDIEELRAKRPRKLASPKLGISTHDWMLEAIAEKMEKERKKFNVTP